MRSISSSCSGTAATIVFNTFHSSFVDVVASYCIIFSSRKFRACTVAVHAVYSTLDNVNGEKVSTIILHFRMRMARSHRLIIFRGNGNYVSLIVVNVCHKIQQVPTVCVSVCLSARLRLRQRHQMPSLSAIISRYTHTHTSTVLYRRHCMRKLIVISSLNKFFSELSSRIYPILPSTHHEPKR